MIAKRPRRSCPLHRRDLCGIGIREERLAAEYLAVGEEIGLWLDDAEDDDDYDSLLDQQEICIAQYVQLKYVMLPFHHMPVQRLVRTIDSFHDNQISEMFRFRTKFDLRSSMISLHIPLIVTTVNRCKFSGEELFLFFLRRLGTTGKLSLLISEFGRDYSQWCRGFQWMVLFIYGTWNHKLSKNIDFFVPHFNRFSEAIRLKCNDCGGCNHQQNNFNVALFIDCNNTPTCRLGAGPANPGGAGQPRNDPDGNMQRGVYNGWLKKHGIKHQSIESPCGLAVHLWGPASCRHSDLWMVEHSNINELLRNSQNGIPANHQKVTYGDGVYVFDTHIRSKHFGPNLTIHQHQTNDGMKSCREFEWSFGQCEQLWLYMSFSHNLKIKSMPLRELYFCKAFLRNCYNCMYHSATSKFFDCPPPSLQEYLA
jgi:hypothetical protein